MLKPTNYDTTKASTGFVPIELGGHILEIKEVLEMQSKTGKTMIRVSFDFAQNDCQPRYFSESFRNDIRPDKKWPAAGTTYIMVNDQDGNCSKQFKTFTTSVEKSNQNFSIVWGDGFQRCFTGKLVGGVFGVIEEEYNGKVHSNRKLRWFRSTEGIKDVEIPEEKKLSGQNQTPFHTDANGFMQLPEGMQEELPF